jgi:bifunctional non-homologous end joining protein LigD
MGLQKYQEKRHFDATPEPAGSRQRTRGPLRFVVQKHRASNLHYDFRIEVDGVLKSWAVPKGPSLNPDDKRLAMMVEDHPFDYRNFEGIIPKGNYGAGEVIIWDEGTYCSRETPDRDESTRHLREGLQAGHITIVVNGQKLKGEFALLKLKRAENNAWLLVKKRDQYASDSDVRADERSVRSGRTLEEIAAEEEAAQKRAIKPVRARRSRKRFAVREAPRAPMPRRVRPMLAALVDEPFDRKGWLFELKWDGYRAVAEVGKNGVSFYSRNSKSFEQRFAPIVESLRELGHEAVLDGEVVVVDSRGRSNFQLLQNYQRTGEGDLRYYAFDVLHLDGYDLRPLPLHRRKELLGRLVEGLPNVLLSEHVEEQGVAFFQAVERQGLEGVMAKDAKSPYREGMRGGEWLKIKAHQRQEAVIGGFTEPKGSRTGLGALVLGVYEGDDLVYIGHTGGGFDTRALEDMRARLEPLEQRTCPFRVKPATNAPAHWVEPRLVCEVRFQEWTDEGILRHPIFLGLREDKPARSVRREVPAPAPGETHSTPVVAASRLRPSRTVGGNGKPPATPDITNPDKVYWPDEGYTKGDLIGYYRAVAPFILPYLRDRPESLHRHPNGINGQSFFQKDVSRQPPPAWVATATVRHESDGRPITYILCQDQPTLLYLANLGCIELNPLHVRVESLDRPDYLVIDLDPEAIPFEHVVHVALEIRKTLEKAGAQCCCKTSGKRGLHVYVPLAARYDDDQARQFAEIVANVVNRKLPQTTSVVRSPTQRQERVYLDFLQNRRAQTLAAPYSVRPYPGATVSTPLRWSEVKKGLDPARYTIRTVPRRLDRVGDLWKPVLGPGIDLADCLERLARQAAR